MLARRKRASPETIGFFLVPKFSMIAFTSAIEPLRMANRMSGEELYNWVLISKGGESVTASNGIAVEPHLAMDRDNKGGDGLALPSIAVVSGIEAERYQDADVFAWLRRHDRKGADIGALCTGSHILARAGLLDGYTCTIHWENLLGFREEFPDIAVTDDLYAIDRNRFTCSGGLAALDMMLHLVAREHGSDLATMVSEQCIVDRIRSGDDHQRLPLGVRLGVRHPKLLDAIRLMESNLEEPLSQRELAEYVGLSRRQIERLYRRHLGRTPARYYRELRLERARHLLYQTGLPVIDVAMACGFVSASHFSKCYRQRYGSRPHEERPRVA
jgi:transcriptional regulator GlxA family with amidase domain